MVTKEQCILNKILEEINYGRGPRLTQYVLAAYNQGKRYASDMVFQNDERGLDQGLEGYSPSFIIYSVLDGDNHYDANDPFFIIDNGLRSIDGYEFEEMLTPEDVRKILCQDVLEELDDNDLYEAFETFVRTNYPDLFREFDYDWLGGYGADAFIKADWNELVKELQTKNINENQVTPLTHKDLKRMTEAVVKRILRGYNYK